jgi:hypothetical protein
MEAWQASEKYVKQFLKFPVDASFPWSEPEIRTNAAGDVFYLKGTVKAKNALGAALTYEWATILRFRDNQWTLLACTVGDEVYKSPELDAAFEEAATEKVRLDKQAAEAAAKANRVAQEEKRKADQERRRVEVTRIWTDATGSHTVEAEFVSYGAGKVKLRKADGSEVILPLDKLSEEDQQWIKDRGKRMR